MNKTIIKNYAMKLNKEIVTDFALKEGVVISEEESSIFVNTIKENIDEILEGNGENIMLSIKDKVSTESYRKMEELFNKYKKFID